MRKKEFINFCRLFAKDDPDKCRRFADILAGNSVKLYLKYLKWLKGVKR